MRARWHAGRFLRILVAPLLLGSVLAGLGATAAAAATCQAWTGGQPADPGGTGTLSAVTMLSACDVWVAGQTGRSTLIEHWTGGSSWTVVPSPNPGDGFNFLTSIRDISPTDIWAVGSYSNPDGSNIKGLILHWNGVRWLQSPSPNPGTFTQLTGVRAVSANDAWAVGSYTNDAGTQTLILHWDGASWTQQSSPNPADDDRLDSVAASSVGSAVAVGSGQAHVRGAVPHAVTLRWDGTAWVPAPSIQKGGPDIENTLTGVATISLSHLAACSRPMALIGREHARAALLAQRDGERQARDQHLAVHLARQLGNRIAAKDVPGNEMRASRQAWSDGFFAIAHGVAHGRRHPQPVVLAEPSPQPKSARMCVRTAAASLCSCSRARSRTASHFPALRAASRRARYWTSVRPASNASCRTARALSSSPAPSYLAAR